MKEYKSQIPEVSSITSKKSAIYKDNIFQQLDPKFRYKYLSTNIIQHIQLQPRTIPIESTFRVFTGAGGNFLVKSWDSIFHIQKKYVKIWGNFIDTDYGFLVDLYMAKNKKNLSDIMGTGSIRRQAKRNLCKPIWKRRGYNK